MKEIIYYFLISLFCSTIVNHCIADGTVEHHILRSQILEDARQPASRETSIYLPEEYGDTNKTYPTMYLFHGATGTNRTFLGSGYSNTYMTGVRVNVIVDRLIEQDRIKPFIVILPNMTREWGRALDPYDDYFVQEVMPFVDQTYRTIDHRDSRAIIGHSEGAHAALHISFSSPELFRLVGGYSAYSPGGPLPGSNIIQSHDQSTYPLQFWLYAGLNDHFDEVIPGNHALVQILETANLPYIYIEDSGTHFTKIAQRLEESIIYFSDNFVYVDDTTQSQGNLVNTWDQLK